MISNIKIPAGSIKVVPFFENKWQFKFSRLDNRVYEMFHDALDDFDSGNLLYAEKKLRLLLDGYPEFIDAYHHLAMIMDETRRHNEARQTWQIALEIGQSAFPETFKKEHHRLPWNILDNRPFLRVYHAWGLQLLAEKNISGALAVFNDILSINPNDNQGIRALAIGCYFQLSQPEQVRTICKRYADDTMEEVLYGRSLALFQLGRNEEACTALKKAIEILPNISRELLKKTHRPPRNLNQGYITHGGVDQAYYYWKQNGKYWLNTKGALDFLASIYKKK